MKRAQVYFLIIVTLSFLSSCGGGGGGSGSVPFFGGVWNGVLLLSSNTCPFTVDIDDDEVIQHTVNQDGTRIVLNTKSGKVFQGVVEGTNGFVVGREILDPTEIVTGVFCTLDAAIRYSGISGDKASLRAVGALACSDGDSSLKCEIEYAGEAMRVS